MKCRFSIGEKVAAIADHSQGYFKKDEEFVVLALMQMCGDWLIKIDEDAGPHLIFCRHGNPNVIKGRFYDQRLFRHLPEIGEMTFEEAFEMTDSKKLAEID